MNQQRTPERSTRPRRMRRSTARWPRWAAIVSVLALLAAPAAWTSRQPATIAVAQTAPTFGATPSSGAAGSSVSLSAEDISRGYDEGTISLSFDNAAITPPSRIVNCTGSDLSYGFGAQCDANAPYSYTIPAGTAPGSYNFVLTITVAGTPSQNLTLTTTFTVLGPASLVVQPTSGPAGVDVMLSATNIPSLALLNGASSISFTFDTAAISPQPTLVQCTSGNGYGFGAQCVATSPYYYLIPAATAPGVHTFELIVGPATGAQVDLKATYQVIAQATVTPTATTAASSTPTVTATAAPSTPTATTVSTAVPPTGTPVPSATSTPAPPTATATVTATPTPKIGALISIVRPEFNGNLVAIFAKGSPGTKVHVDFVIVTPGAHGGTSQAFASHTDHTLGSAGSFAFNIKILVKPYAPGQATLTMKAVTPGGTIQAKRTYHYVVTSS